MKMFQKPKFQPITIVLETAEEANLFWGLVDGTEEPKVRKLAIELSNWFSCGAQLGGERE